MKNDEAGRFVAVMQYFSLNFPERRTDENFLRSYFDDLSDFGIDEIEKVAKAYVRTGDKFPLVSDLIRLLSAPGRRGALRPPTPLRTGLVSFQT
jgi:hypothetical protein